MEDSLDDDDERSVVTSRLHEFCNFRSENSKEAALISLIFWQWSGKFHHIIMEPLTQLNIEVMFTCLQYLSGWDDIFFPHNDPLIIFREEQLHYVITCPLGH